MEKCKKIKKSIAILCPSYDERYLLCVHSRAKFSVLDTQTDCFVFEEKIRPATSVCFSSDDKEIYVYDSEKKTVTSIAVGTWETLGTIEISEFRKADKNNWGSIYPTKKGFCINFCWRRVINEGRMCWNTLVYDKTTGEKRIFEDAFYNNYDYNTGKTIIRWGDCYAVLSEDGQVEKQVSYRQDVCEDGIVLSDVKYTVKARKYKGKYSTRLLTSPLGQSHWQEVCKYSLDFHVYHENILMQKDRFVFCNQHTFAVVDRKGNVLAQAGGRYAFSGVTANKKLYIADWTELCVVPYE